MDKLPWNKLIVIRKLSPTSSLLTTFQAGFAPIALVILLLFGIAAGTLLVQKGVNFLPKAQQSTGCTPENKDYCESKGCECITAFGPDSDRKTELCTDPSVFRGFKGGDSDKTMADNNISGSSKVLGEKTKTLAKLDCDLEVVQIITPGSGKAGTDCSIPDNVNRCTRIGTVCQKSKPTGSEYCVDNTNNACINGNIVPFSGGNFTAFTQSCPNGCSFNSSSKKYECNQAPATGYTETDTCSIEEKSKCVSEGGSGCRVTNNRHYCISSKDNDACLSNKVLFTRDLARSEKTCREACGFDMVNKYYTCLSQSAYDAWRKDVAARAAPAAGTGPEIQAKDCDPETAKKCPSNNIGCYEIEGRPRCVFPAANSLDCTDGEKRFCKNPPDPRDDCEVAQAVIVKDQTKTPIKFTRCTAAKGTTATTPTTPSSKGTAPIAPTVQSGTSSQTSTTTPTGATSADCGYEYNGTRIPCYKIGVFDDKISTIIEEQARIASANYKIYEQVLRELGGLMDAGAKTKADAALKTAQNAAACMNGTGATNTTANTTVNTTTTTATSTLTPCGGSGSTCPLSTKACHLSRIDSKWYCVDKGVFNKDFYCGDISEEFSNRCPSSYPTCDKYGQCRNSANVILPGTPKQIQ